MADNPHAQQAPHDNDLAGSTQMFRRFVDDQPAGGPAAATSPGPRVGLILGGVVAVAVLVAVVWLALG